MRDDVIARAFEVIVDSLIEPVVRRFAQVTCFQKFEEMGGGSLDEQKRSRFQRFDEALRETDRKAVLVPMPSNTPDPHFQVTGGGLGVQHPEALAQFALGFVGRAKCRAIDVAVAETTGERDLPPPPVLERG